MDDAKDDEELVRTANNLLMRIGRDPYIKLVNECNHTFFIDVYEAMLGESLPGCTTTFDTVDGMTSNVQAIIDMLSEEVLGVDISHVSASLIVNEDREHIQCLLEIFDGLLQYVLEELDQDGDTDQRMPRHVNGDRNDYDSSDSSDSDVLDENHEILSDVIQEEFGQRNRIGPVKLSTNLAFDKKRAIAPLSGVGDSVTWKSGENSHTVGWSDAGLAHSPSGDSTTTDELISFAQKSGNSTDELIKEAQIIQKDVDLSRSTNGCVNGIEEKTKEYTILSPPMNHWLSFLPSATSHESLVSNKNKNYRYEKFLEKDNEKKQAGSRKHRDSSRRNGPRVATSPSSACSSASSSDFKILDMTTDSLQATEPYVKEVASYKDSTSTKEVSDLSVSMLFVKPRKKRANSGGVDEVKVFVNERNANTKKSSVSDRGNIRKSDTENDVNRKKVRKTHRRNGTSGWKSHIENGFENGLSSGTHGSGSEKKKVGGERDNENEKISVTKVVGAKEEHLVQDVAKSISVPPQISYQTVNNGIDTVASIDEKPCHDGAAKVQKNIQHFEPVTDSRSKQLSDLSERLLKLRKQVGPHIPIPRQSNISADTNLRQSNITEDMILRQSNISGDTFLQQSNVTESAPPGQSTNIEDTISVPTNIATKEKKDKAKVSFQLDSQLDTYQYSLSDTEIDYKMLSSLTDSHMESDVLKGKLRNKIGPKHKKDKKPSALRKNILTTKSIQEDSSTSVNETTLSPEQNITPRFEKQYLKRDERLHRLHKGLKVEEKENKRSVQKLSDEYSKHHGKLLNQKKMVQKQNNLQMKTQKQKEKEVETFSTSPPRGRSIPRLRATADNKYAAKLSAIYGKASPTKPNLKGQKRSASTSPVARRRYKTPMVLEENDILPVMEDEFPFIHLSPHTAKLMWQKQLRQVNNLRKYGKPHKTLKIQRTIEDAHRKQNALASMMKREIEHNRRLKELKERQDEDTVVKRNLHERRQRSARARRYYNEYAIQNKARMLKKRTKEEKIFKQLFEDGLDIQKQRINEMRAYAREQKEKNAKKQQDEIDSLENFYKDKFSCLAESVAQEKHEVEVRQKAQSQVLNKMRSNMRKRMEKDLEDIQEQLNNDEDACFFRQLDADVLKKEFQLATYKASRLR